MITRKKWPMIIMSLTLTYTILLTIGILRGIPAPLAAALTMILPICGAYIGRSRTAS